MLALYKTLDSGIKKYTAKKAMLLIGDSRKSLKTVPSESCQMCVTSPPYFGLRDYETAKWYGGNKHCDHKGPPIRTGASFHERYYGKKFVSNKQADQRAPMKNVCSKCGAIRIDSQIGIEDTLEEYVNNIVLIFKEVKRILKSDGTLWLNIGDTYASIRSYQVHNLIDKKGHEFKRPGKMPKGLKQKDLMGIPWRVALALQADGWYLRSDIIWAKSNAMPESVLDRPTKSHEYLFLFSKNKKYYYNAEAIKEPAVYQGNQRSQKRGEFLGKNISKGKEAFRAVKKYRNKRDVWFISSQPYHGAHFATYPKKLIEPCILAGSKKNSIVLDPFGGSGTTGEVCLSLDRKVVLCELNSKYISLIDERLEKGVHERS